jgi:hypothetical protein
MVAAQPERPTHVRTKAANFRERSVWNLFEGFQGVFRATYGTPPRLCSLTGFSSPLGAYANTNNNFDGVSPEIRCHS